MSAPSSIDPARFLHDQLASASPDLLRQMLTTFINTLMSAEADAVCGAAYGEPSPQRVNIRNGYRHRDFDTHAGTLDVAIPKLRSGSYFPDWLLERRRRAERALTTVVATCYLLGVSTRRMEKLVESLGITRLSKSQVSTMAAELDAQVADFRTRPLDAGPYTFVAADALVLKVREGGRVVKRARPARDRCERRRAQGDPRAAGHFGRGRRGLAGVLPRPDRARPDRVKLVTSDAHHGLVTAIGATLPGASWQRCRTHYAANLMAATPKASWPWVRALLYSVYDQPDATSVHAQFDRVLDAVAEKLPKVAEQLDAARADVLAFTGFPKEIWRQIWSNKFKRAAQPRDPSPHRRGRDLPRPRRTDPSGRRRAGRATRRMGRRTSLPGSGPCCASSHAITTITVRTAAWDRQLPYGHFPTVQRPGPARSTDATASAASSTNISTSHDMTRGSGTHRSVLPARSDQQWMPRGGV
jgi:transposase-like protein